MNKEIRVVYRYAPDLTKEMVFQADAYRIVENTVLEIERKTKEHYIETIAIFNFSQIVCVLVQEKTDE